MDVFQQLIVKLGLQQGASGGRFQLLELLQVLLEVVASGCEQALRIGIGQGGEVFLDQLCGLLMGLGQLAGEGGVAPLLEAQLGGAHFIEVVEDVIDRHQAVGPLGQGVQAVDGGNGQQRHQHQDGRKTEQQLDFHGEVFHRGNSCRPVWMGWWLVASVAVECARQ
ncbi:hypothetical protein D9M71_544930 [compost metagenome]